MIGAKPPTHEWKTSWLPQGKRQEVVASSLGSKQVATIFPHQLYKKGEEKILNEGFSIGNLKVLSKADFENQEISYKDIVILDFLPDDLSAVAGIITTVDQPFLSHLNVLSQNRGTPNIFVDGALTKSPYQNLIGSLVKFKVRNGKVELSTATSEEFELFWSVKRPVKTMKLSGNIAHKQLIQLKGSLAKTKREFLKETIGMKATNLQEINMILPKSTPSFSFGIPFHYYVEHFKKGTILKQIQDAFANKKFQEDSLFIKELLK
jgi:pyruvate,water dikinase